MGLTLSMGSPLHAEVIACLRCPVCHQGMLPSQPPSGPLRCRRGHSFDQAKQGYAQLTATRLAHTGDTAEMVAARVDFLGRGHYDPISDVLADVVRQAWSSGLVIDAGAGTGHHTARVLGATPSAYGLALDASKACARVAARAHPRLDAVVCDVWQPLPVADRVAGVVMNVFAPRSGREFARVLNPGGVLVSVTPQPGHLSELVRPLDLLRVDPDKPERVTAELGERFSLADATRHDWVMSLDHEEVAAAVAMGPSAWHRDPAALATAIAALPAPMAVTAAVGIGIYQLR